MLQGQLRAALPADKKLRDEEVQIYKTGLNNGTRWCLAANLVPARWVSSKSPSKFDQPCRILHLEATHALTSLEVLEQMHMERIISAVLCQSLKINVRLQNFEGVRPIL